MVQEKTLQVTIGGLVHDIGKIIYRIGTIDKSNHGLLGRSMVQEYIKQENVLDCIRFHHKNELKSAHITKDSPAYITYISDNIAAGADRREIEKAEKNKGFDMKLPLSSIFNLMHGNNLDYSYPIKKLGDIIQYPLNSGQNKIIEHQYQEILQGLKKELCPIEMNENSVNSLLAILEKYLSFIPSSTAAKEIADISLFSHSKITAAVGACICEYLLENEISDFKRELLENEKEFNDKKAFLMYSSDFSGIQRFIYNISSKGALKSLRSRSFFLEMLMEHCIDEVLSGCGVTRANLIYSGGGHCYILLPNTQKVRSYLTELQKTVNSWLCKNFGTGLYLVTAFEECSADDLMNIPEESSPYKKIYENLSAKLSAKKLHRYSAEEIKLLNSFSGRLDGRECKICGAMCSLIQNEDICSWCQLFKDISSVLLQENLIIAVSKKEIPDIKKVAFPTIIGEVFMHFTDEIRIKEELKKGTEVIRIYSKNEACADLAYSTKIYMGDYSFDKLLEELAEDAQGIKRMAVYRADVDNLGLAFISGFERNSNEPKQKYRYVTLSRTADFSRQMSLFFKNYINGILKGTDIGQQFSFSENTVNKDGRRIVIVYSGGDDIFITGTWDDVLGAAIDIKRAFERFTAGTLTLSGGIGIYKVKYPIYKAAYDTAELEDLSKKLDGKNGISLFSTLENHIYHWDEFIQSVVGEKLTQLQNFFDYDKEEQERGKAFLYRLLDLLRTSNDRINIARYAYLLARLEPKATSKTYKHYRTFSQHMYHWIQDEKDKKELITAIYIYIYLTRKRREE